MTLALLLVVQLVAGASLPVTKLALTGLGPFAVAGARLVVALPFLLLLARGRGRAPIGPLLVLGAVGFGATQTLQAFGAQHTTSADATVLGSTTAIFSTLFGFLLLAERPTALTLFGIAVAIAGSVLVVGPAFAGGPALLGDLVVLVGVATWALYLVRTRALVVRVGAPRLTAFATLGGVLVAAPLGAVDAALSAPRLDAAVVGAVLFLGLGIGVFVAGTWSWLMGRVSAALAGAFSFLQPVMGLALTELLFGEPLAPLFLTGTALVALGVVLATLGDEAVRRPAMTTTS